MYSHIEIKYLSLDVQFAGFEALHKTNNYYQCELSKGTSLSDRQYFFSVDVNLKSEKVFFEIQ